MGNFLKNDHSKDIQKCENIGKEIDFQKGQEKLLELKDTHFPFMML